MAIKEPKASHIFMLLRKFSRYWHLNNKRLGGLEKESGRLKNILILKHMCENILDHLNKRNLLDLNYFSLIYFL